MAQDNPSYEIPTEMRDFAEKSVEQARKAFDSFMGAAQRTVDTLENSATNVQSNTTDITRKTFNYAEQNVTAAFEHAQKLVRAKDVQEAMQLQAEFVRNQFAAMQNQMRDLGAIAQAAAQTAAQNTANQAREFGSMAQEATRSATSQSRGKQKR
jgi:phasin